MDERLAESGKPARLFSFGAMLKMLPFLLRTLRLGSMRTLKKSAETDFRALTYMRPLAIWAIQWELASPDFRL